MRVIAGSAGGLTLTVPPSVTRPTTDRVREALFSSLGERVVGAAVLDLYAGSGALGIEALSRGAVSAVFVEEDERACDTLRKNLDATRLADSAKLRRTRVTDYLRRLAESGAPRSVDRFDLVFADPPYARDSDTRAELAALLASKTLARALRADGLFIVEAMDGADLPLPAAPPTNPWTHARDRRYGGTRLHFLQRAA